MHEPATAADWRIRRTAVTSSAQNPNNPDNSRSVMATAAVAEFDGSATDSVESAIMLCPRCSEPVLRFQVTPGCVVLVHTAGEFVRACEFYASTFVGRVSNSEQPNGESIAELLRRAFDLDSKAGA